MSAIVGIGGSRQMRPDGSTVAAATYVVGSALLFTLLAPLVAEPVHADRVVAFLADNQAVAYVWNLVIYVVNGVARRPRRSGRPCTPWRTGSVEASSCPVACGSC